LTPLTNFRLTKHPASCPNTPVLFPSVGRNTRTNALKRKAVDIVPGVGRSFKVVKKSAPAVIPVVSLLETAFDALDQDLDEMIEDDSGSESGEVRPQRKNQGHMEMELPTPVIHAASGLVSLKNGDFVFPWSSEASAMVAGAYFTV